MQSYRKRNLVLRVAAQVYHLPQRKAVSLLEPWLSAALGVVGWPDFPIKDRDAMQNLRFCSLCSSARLGKIQLSCTSPNMMVHVTTFSGPHNLHFGNQDLLIDPPTSPICRWCQHSGNQQASVCRKTITRDGQLHLGLTRLATLFKTVGP